MNRSLILLDHDEYTLRLSRMQQAVASCADAAILSDKATLYWLTGRVFAGFAYVPADGTPLFGLRRCVQFESDGVTAERKIEDFARHVAAAMPAPGRLALEMDSSSYSAVARISAAFAAQWPDAETVNAGAALRAMRAVKTPQQIEMMRRSGLRQEAVYRRIPAIYTPGMTDYELQVEIERESRLEGCLGQFRTAGDEMELFMGNVLTGDNADTPSPYDFAMGGAGMDPSLPVGADGSVIRRGCTVMVDVNGNYTGYMTDMTRTYRLGDIPAEALRAHELSREICRRLAEMGTPGRPAREMYETALGMAREAGLEHRFMGHRQQAGFVGHGLGIEINEAPVIAPRSRDILAEGMCIALEPKFVIAGVGAVGIENTYVVRADGRPMECITNAPEEIIDLDK
jgi:Xaa-Pro aminopeptidase